MSSYKIQGSIGKEKEKNRYSCRIFVVVPVTVVQRNRTNRIPLGREVFKELAHRIMGAGKSDICGMGWKFRQELMFQTGGRISSSGDLSWCSRPEVDWMRPKLLSMTST